MLSATLLVVVGYLSARSDSKPARGPIGEAFAYAIATVVLFDLGGLIVMGLLRGER